MSQAASRKGSDQSAENSKAGSKTKTRSRNGCPLCKAKRVSEVVAGLNVIPIRWLKSKGNS